MRHAGGKGGAGFPILLTLVLRPLFIVIGFGAGIAFNWVVGHTINATAQPALSIQNADGGWFGNLFQVAGTLLVFSGLHLFASYKSYSLTWELPNAILRWMGVQDHADLGERESKENIVALGGGFGRGASAVTKGAVPKEEQKGGPNDGDKGGQGKEDGGQGGGSGNQTGGDQPGGQGGGSGNQTGGDQSGGQGGQGGSQGGSVGEVDKNVAKQG